MAKIFARIVPLVLVVTLFAAACGDSDDGNEGSGGTTTTAAPAEPVDYAALGLWDDGACDSEKPPLKLGLMTVFESPVLSLEDQADALEAAAEAFNGRGGANGSCIEVTTCDDGGTIDQAVACVRTLQDAGVVATVNDQGTAGQAEVSAAMQQAKIPRVAANVTNADWGDPNAYPLDASGTGVVFLMPQALINNERNKVGIVRVDLAAASAMKGLLEQTYEGDATFPYDAPIPGGTTDFTQFILGAQDKGSDSLMLASGEQEALQVVNAGEQLSTPMKIGASLGSFPHRLVADLGDFADQMVFLWAYPPATFDLPVYEALRADLAASGNEQLQPENLKASPMRSWIGLYALLKMMRDAKMTEFTGEGITAMLKQAKNVPMLGIYGDENWTPDTNHPGLYKRAGTNHWATYSWDADAPAPGGLEGNFVETSTMSFDETLCDSIFGGPC
jgi:ABC-type branched-subunit amino acid transport system substrate-binding protein